MDRNPVVTGQSQLEAPTKGKAVDRTDDRLGEVLQGFEQRRDGRLLAAHLAGGDLAELVDVGPATERAAPTDQDDPAHTVVPAKFFKRLPDIAQDRRAQGIDGRVVQGDDTDLTLADVADRSTHEITLSSSCWDSGGQADAWRTTLC